MQLLLAQIHPVPAIDTGAKPVGMDSVSEEEKVQYFARCLAAIYLPFDEDSYGYPSLEAHHARK